MPPDDHLSLGAAAAALDATEPGGGVRGSELVRRIRWADGHQGAGPLSVQALLYTTGTGSLGAAARAIDPAAPAGGVREAYARLGHPLGGGATVLPPAPSLREAARRVIGPGVVPIRLVSYNTYLLPGIQIPIDRWIDDAIGWDALGWFGIPFGGALLELLGVQSIPGLAIGAILELADWKPSTVIRKVTGLDLGSIIRRGAKPALDARSAEVGPALAEYDACCLCEVWKGETAERILRGIRAARGDAWQGVAGPGADGPLVVYGSGLYFLSRRFPIVRTARLVFESRGERRHDSDAWANKGVLLNAIDTGAGELELFQTHLYYGGGFAGAPGVLAEPLGIRDPTDAERAAAQRAQLDELARFYREHHRPSSVAIVTGDFNMSGADIRQYAVVRQVMDGLNLRDLWAWDVFRHAPAGGQTCRYTDDEPMEGDFGAVCGLAGKPDGAGAFCDDDQPAPRPRRGVGRFDFMFVENPTPEHRCRVELARPRRRPFRRAQPGDGEAFLSDHLGLDTTLFVSARR